MRVRKKQHHDRSNRESDTSAKESSSAGTTILDGLALIQRGNEYFFSDCYLEATGYYYQAAMILKSSKEHRVDRSKAWSNVAECHLRLKNWQAAEDAASNALGADSTNSKARYRRAKARFELCDYAGAAKDAESVGTHDAMDVAALCRELAHAEVARKLTTTTRGGIRRTTSGGGGRRAHHGTRQPVEEERRDSPPTSPVRPTMRPTMRPEPQSLEERDLWFRRIIDSYRLRVDDEYTKAGAADSGCLYGIRAKGGKKSPIDHFQSYVQRAIKKRVLPPWFLIGDMDELCRMATTDTFSNINVGVTPEEIMEFYTGLAMGMRHDELHELRNLAVFIEGPIGMPWTRAHDSVAPEKHTRSTPERHKRRTEAERRAKSVPRDISEPVHFRKTTSFDLNHNSEHSPEMHVGHIYPVKTQQNGRNGLNHYHDARRQTVEHREPQERQNSFLKLQRAPSDTRQPRAPSTPVAQKHQTDKIYGRFTQPIHLYAKQEHQQDTQVRSSYSPPRREKSMTGRIPVKQQTGWGHPTQQQQRRSEARPYRVSGEMRAPSMPVVRVSDESDSAATEYESFGPQLPYQASMLSQGYTKRPVTSDFPNNQMFYGDNLYEEYDSQEGQDDTSTAQEVRHGLSYRDEFSELTELSP